MPVAKNYLPPAPNWFKSQNNPPVSSPHPTTAKAVKNSICF